MKRNQFGALIIVAVILVLAAAGCIGQSSRPIRIAISAWAGVEPAELAARLGYYEKNGVDVKMVRFSAYSDSIEALRAGKTDAGMHTLDDAIRHRAAGRDVQIVLLTDYSHGADGIVARRGIDSVADLKGTTVGVELATVGHFSLLKALEMAGLSEKDITIVNIPAWEIKEAFLAGKIDAGVTWEPYLTSSAEEGDGTIIVTSQAYPESIVTSMVFDAETIRQRPDDVQRVVKAYFEAVDYMAAHPQEANHIMAEAEGVSDEEFAAHLGGIRILDRNANVDLLADSPNGRFYQTAREMAEFLAEKKVIRQAIDVATLFEPRFVLSLQPQDPSSTQ